MKTTKSNLSFGVFAFIGFVVGFAINPLLGIVTAIIGIKIDEHF